MSEIQIDSVDFRTAMAGFATGVTVISVRDELDDVAITATSFTSVSLEPPMVLVCIEENTHMHDVMTRVDLFGVSLLAGHQRTLASQFGASGRPSARVLLSGINHHRGELSGALLIERGTAALECRTMQRIEAADHMVVLAEVLAVDYVDHGAHPLVRYRHRYHELKE